MSLMHEVKPKNARTARLLKSREPQLTEQRKRVLLLHGTRCPDPLRLALKTFTTLTKPHAVLLTKKNADIHPFTDASSLEFLAGKNECAMVCFAQNSKKRPNAMTVARIFDGKVLDMLELLLTSDEKGLMQIGVEMKPMIVFAGAGFEDQSEDGAVYRLLKGVVLDLFQGEEIGSVDVAGLQHVLCVSAGEVVSFRWYKMKTARSDTPGGPRVELDQVGPGFDFRIGRHRVADAGVMKEAMKHGRKEARVKKNIETDLVGDKLGRIHLGKQDLSELQTRKMKGLKRSRDVEDDEAGVDEDEDDVVSQSDEDDGGMVLESDEGESGDEIDIGDSEDEADQMPKRQRLQ